MDADVKHLREVNAALLEALKAVVKYGRDELAWDLEAEADEMLADADAAIALATGGDNAG